MSALLDRLRAGLPIDAPVALVVAHPDDEVLGLGSRLHCFRNLRIIVLTDGAPEDMADARAAGFATRAAYAAARQAEQARALACVGAGGATRVFYGYGDQCAIQHIGEIRRRLEAELADVVAVFTHAYEHGHPDHDAAAFAVAAACGRMTDPPQRYEFAGYHLGLSGPVYGSFWPDNGSPAVLLALNAAAEAQKRAALACYLSQARVIAPFPTGRELVRPAPAYDFTAPAPPGRALYDAYGWSMTAVLWRQLATAAAATGTSSPLRVVNVSYPFAAVTSDPVGGAEQVLARLDRALVAAGHRSIVIAPEGSSVAGELRSVPAVHGLLTDAMRDDIHAAVRDHLAAIVSAGEADVIHMHGIDFTAYLPPPGPSTLVTLHLPLSWYDAVPRRPNTWLQPVSASQARAAPPGMALTAPIENGVETTALDVPRQDYALILGRVCPEKGFDDAVDAARDAEAPLLLAGAVFPYREHQDYFERRIVPRLDRLRRWVGAVTGYRKKKLMAQARCLLVPSKAPETSSLVAMEALAAGTPVIAYRSGALPEIVEHGRTGFIVDSVREMSAAIRRIDTIDPAVCRARARERFSAARMVDAYLARYAALALP